MQRACYLALTQVGESLRALLKQQFSIHAMVQVKDHSVDDLAPTISALQSTTQLAVQFQHQQQRGFILFPFGLSQWLMSELFGAVPPTEPSLFSEFLIQSLMDDGFKLPELLQEPQVIDVNSIWIHPTFDAFFPMSVSVFQTPQQALDIWVFFPKERSES